MAKEQVFLPGQLVKLNALGAWEARNYDKFTVVTDRWVKSQGEGKTSSLAEFQSIDKDDVLLIVREDGGSGVYLALLGDILVYIPQLYFEEFHG